MNPSWEREETTADNELRLYPAGEWRLQRLETMPELSGVPVREQSVVVDGSRLTALDTAGAMVVLQQLEAAGIHLDKAEFRNFPNRALNVLNLVRERTKRKEEAAALPKAGSGVFVKELLRRWTAPLLSQLSFLGEVLASTAVLILRPGQFRLKETVIQLERVGVRAIPIIGLVTFLIGIVLAYLFANQAEKFGANIFVVNALGMGMCRELSPIIVAIIVAGRSGSAFTAQIGTMRLNEEIDAIETLGLSVFQILIIPRLLALMISLPLLVLVGDAVGICGGAIIADSYLGVAPRMFFDRLRDVLELRHVFVGVGKAPVFALFIGLIACRLGLTVEKNARSLGFHTTSTVVQSVVAVILLNAGFAVLFQELGW